jgi:endonuclease V-like protein UPF0215 family
MRSQRKDDEQDENYIPQHRITTVTVPAWCEKMADTYKIANININGVSSHKITAMLEDFMRKQELDIIFLQEVTQPVFDKL